VSAQSSQSIRLSVDTILLCAEKLTRVVVVDWFISYGCQRLDERTVSVTHKIDAVQKTTRKKFQA